MNEALSLAGLFSAPGGNHVAARLRGWNFLLAQENSGLMGRLCSAAREYPPYDLIAAFAIRAEFEHSIFLLSDPDLPTSEWKIRYGGTFLYL